MRILIVLSILLILFTQCNNNPVTDRNSEKEIRGYITEKFSGLAIDSVKVSLQATDYSAFTDSTGFYSFKDMSYDKYRIIVEKEKYKTSDSLVEYFGNGIMTVSFKLSKNKLLAATDSLHYTQGLIKYGILNNTIFSAYFKHCCFNIVYTPVENINGSWVFSDWKNMECSQPCNETPIELFPDSTQTGIVSINKSGTYKIAFLHGYNPEFTMTDTVFTNIFTVTNK